jgi:hypothetical protein
VLAQFWLLPSAGSIFDCGKWRHPLDLSNESKARKLKPVAAIALLPARKNGTSCLFAVQVRSSVSGAISELISHFLYFVMNQLRQYAQKFDVSRYIFFGLLCCSMQPFQF